MKRTKSDEAPDGLDASQKAIWNIDHAHMVRCAREDWPDVKKALIAQVKIWEVKDVARAHVTKQEIARLDEKFSTFTDP